MTYKQLFIILIGCLIVLPTTAQKRKAIGGKGKAAPVVVEEPSKFDMMLDNTQQIMFIDSIVVDKKQFLESYHLSNEAGRIATYNQFFNTNDQPYSTVYVNELNSKCWYAKDGTLYTSDRLESQWGNPAPLEGLGHYQRSNYPFMLSDGTTFYFAAISDEGLGGLDIYVSRYDSESNSYLLAENIGLPFNSEANDYMFAIDELNNIGFFATDRRQPEGYVCIYTFIPNQKRITYAASGLSEEEIISRAKLECIADTWTDENIRQDALNSIRNIQQQDAKPTSKDEFSFVINDNITYHHFSDFRDAANKERMKTLIELKQHLANLQEELDRNRKFYGKNASDSEKENIKADILMQEQYYSKQYSDIRKLEKTIRNSEIKAL